MKKLVEKFLNGDVALWKSYWLVGELLNALMILIIFNIEVNFFDNKIISDFLPFFNFKDINFFNKVILILWTLLITIGIWRSAEKYNGPILWIFITLIFLSYRIFSLRIIFLF